MSRNTAMNRIAWLPLPRRAEKIKREMGKSLKFGCFRGAEDRKERVSRKKISRSSEICNYGRIKTHDAAFSDLWPLHRRTGNGTWTTDCLRADAVQALFRHRAISGLTNICHMTASQSWCFFWKKAGCIPFKTDKLKLQRVHDRSLAASSSDASDEDGLVPGPESRCGGIDGMSCLLEGFDWPSAD